MPECFAPTGRGPMKTQGFEPRFSQNLAPVGAKQDTKTLISFIFHIYSALVLLLIKNYFSAGGNQLSSNVCSRDI
ncbi:MAG: hypothetical protein DWQ58_24690 [Microcystis aeruginosa TA09]|uniref:Uncharacterized protein n=1 Tax=Microcystis flos-aquae Mf_QC_C_20070823_S10D TaxID=2486236 RepID=A0A552KX00_9CHRO|nr:MAG: hypothetical protein DWQ58_24690 [Microcystis aeruginosa TA09]TRT68101.1 MAG: hypothetical protein EWV67_03020 [Microcystis sp. M_QC_C_20170808_M2Col]TRT73422.1 MAG: hypothetical protein EWV68_00045 [Microcystis sp. M_QC_C_20170808_M9Col]TRT74073.1 MAG: hypothetical protein EWV64_15245 [Microcystis flos-aquae Ma_QC_C_20070823_S18]TRT90930.1 MAG: hypothetical protein EWV65_23195 [Microcystis flos-aquae Ma_QC_C_20070823_S18D]TRV12504.1 MAG: hypothetical protein EWV45_09320 [Microcystis f